MKTAISIGLTFLLAACGASQTTSDSTPPPSPGPSAPNAANNPAVATAEVSANANANSADREWPASGLVSCVIDTPEFSGTYQVQVSSGARAVHVAYNDAFNAKQYSADIVYDMTKTQDEITERNKQYASVWDWEDDVGNGYARGWGFALDMSTLTLWINNWVNPDQTSDGNAGHTQSFTVVDCTITQ